MSEFAPVIIVTGTGPSVGKTVAMAAMVVGLRAQGLRVVVAKLAQTGLLPGEPGDLRDICRLAGDVETHELVRLPDPLAPDAAAGAPPDADADAPGRRAGVVFPSTADLGAKLAGIAGRDDVDAVLVEGAGGLLVRMDGEGSTVADVGSELTALGVNAGYVVVALAGRGTLNHSALTAEALRTRGLGCLGFVIGSWPQDPDLAMRTNAHELASVTGARLLGRVPAGAGQWGPDEFQAEAAGWISI